MIATIYSNIYCAFYKLNIWKKELGIQEYLSLMMKCAKVRID